MAVVLEQVELLFRMKARPVASTTQRALVVGVLVAAREGDRVPVVAELDVLTRQPPKQVDARRQACAAELVLEAAAVELVAGNGRELVGPRSTRWARSLLSPAGNQKRSPHLWICSFSMWSFMPSTSPK